MEQRQFVRESIDSHSNCYHVRGKISNLQALQHIETRHSHRLPPFCALRAYELAYILELANEELSIFSETASNYTYIILIAFLAVTMPQSARKWLKLFSLCALPF